MLPQGRHVALLEGGEPSVKSVQKSTLLKLLKLLKLLWDSSLLKVVAHTVAVGQLGAVDIRP